MTLALRTVRDWRVAVLIVVGLLVAVLVYASGSSDAVRATTDTNTSTCATPRPLTAGLSRHTLAFAGQQRTFEVYVPDSYDGTKRSRAVFLFHGYGGSPDKVLGTSGMLSVADDEGFIVVAPQALGAKPEWDFRSPGTVATSDVSFVRELVAKVRGGACLDPDGLFAAGFSNGAAFSLALACDADSPFQAYGAVSGPYYGPACKTAAPASIAYFHGLVDPVVPYTGATTVIGPLPGVDDTIAHWVSHDRCPSKGARTSVKDGVRHYSWKGCADGTAISVYALGGMGHRWPVQVAAASAGQSKAGASLDAVDASRLMWSFFTRAEKAADRD